MCTHAHRVGYLTSTFAYMPGYGKKVCLHSYLRLRLLDFPEVTGFC